MDLPLAAVYVNHEPKVMSMKLHIADDPGRPAWTRPEFGLELAERQQLLWVQGRPYFNDDRNRDIGQLQGWYAMRDRTAMIWEMILDRDHQPDPREDLLYRVLWRRSEDVLRHLFPHMIRLLTPSWEPDYDRETYQSFLTGMGYSPFTERAWWKPTRQLPA